MIACCGAWWQVMVQDGSRRPETNRECALDEDADGHGCRSYAKHVRPWVCQLGSRVGVGKCRCDCGCPTVGATHMRNHQRRTCGWRDRRAEEQRRGEGHECRQHRARSLFREMTEAPEVELRGDVAADGRALVLARRPRSRPHEGLPPIIAASPCGRATCGPSRHVRSARR
jgi:hypothetical protein